MNRHRVSFNLDEVPLSPTSTMDSLSPVPVHIEVNGSSLNTTIDEHNPDPFSETEHDLDQQMDQAEETVHRGWTTSLQRITNNTVIVRPAKSSFNPSVSTGVRKNTSTPIHFSPGRPKSPERENGINCSHISRCDPDETLTPARSHERLHEVSSSKTSIDGYDEEKLSPLFVMCPTTGEKIFRMEFDTDGYTPEQIKLELRGKRLVLRAMQNEFADGRRSVSEFCRRVKIPDEVNVSKLSCLYDPSTNKIIAQAPVMRLAPFWDASIYSARSSRDSTLGGRAPQSPRCHKLLQLNSPVFKTIGQDEKLYLDADIGRVFKSSDIVVRVVGDNKIEIQAAHKEDGECSNVNAEISRQFILQASILPHTLRAEFSGAEGILKITADLKTSKPTEWDAEVRVEIVTEK